MILSSLLIGLAGGLHCGLMCGPLQAAIFGKEKLSTSFFLYQGGRVLTYIFIGLAFYIFGKGASFLGLQETFVYLICAYIIYFYLLPFKWRQIPVLRNLETVPFNFFKKHLSFGKQNYASRFVAGLINGLLPCGMVYMAAANATLASSLALNMFMMIVFGLATIPWLLASQFVVKLPLKFIQPLSLKYKPILAMIVVGLLLFRTVPLPFLHGSEGSQNGSDTKEITVCGSGSIAAFPN